MLEQTVDRIDVRLEADMSALQSRHFTVHTAQNGQVVYAMSGLVEVDAFPAPTAYEAVTVASAPHDPNFWRRRQVRFTVPIDLEGDQRLRIVHWAPFVAAAGVIGSKDRPGFAVDSFQVAAIHPDGNDSVEIVVDLAVRDLVAKMFKLAYHVDLVGELVDG